ncbi:MAG TPA: phospholipase D-like domain-containing protein, partial [Polyangia bacterium]|nr:phospholipase D-like domain-containing protein [Polyangia bacterium]
MSPRRAPPPLLALLALGSACSILEPPTPTPASPAPTGDRPVQLLIEPDAGRAAVLDLLASARTSLWMEMYLLTDDDAIAALAGRAAAGCDVRVILEPAPYQQAGANQAAYDRLAAAGVDVRWSLPRFTYTHAKAFTVDHA